MSSQKRIRSRNFTPQEKEHLLDCIKPFIEIVDCPETNKKMNEMKDEAWAEIETAFNSKNDLFRDAKALKSMYKHFKLMLKKELSAYQQQVAAGENVEPPELDACATKLLSMTRFKNNSLNHTFDYLLGQTSNTNSMDFEDETPIKVEDSSIFDEQQGEVTYQPPPDFIDTQSEEPSPIQVPALASVVPPENSSGNPFKARNFQSRLRAKRKFASIFGVRSRPRSRSPQQHEDDELLQLKKENYKKQNELLEKQIQATELDIQLKRAQLRNYEPQVDAIQSIKRLLQQVVVRRQPFQM